MGQGIFITFEGGEGAGKSTQIKFLAETLTKAGRDVVLTREPGGSPGAERIRRLMVEGKADQWDAKVELLLATAARQDHVQKCILPALDARKIVLCDRFVHSTLAYQVGRDGVTADLTKTLHTQIIGDLWPNLTLIFDIDPKTALARAQERDGHNQGRFEQMGLQFHQDLRSKFLALSHEDPVCQVIAADQSRDVVAEAVWGHVSAFLDA